MRRIRYYRKSIFLDENPLSHPRRKKSNILNLKQSLDLRAGFDHFVLKQCLIMGHRLPNPLVTTCPVFMKNNKSLAILNDWDTV